MVILPIASCTAKPPKAVTSKASYANMSLQKWFDSQSKSVVLVKFETYPKDSAKIGLNWAEAQYAETTDPVVIKKIMKQLSKSGIHTRQYNPEIDNFDADDAAQSFVVLTFVLKGQRIDGEQIWLSLSPNSKGYTLSHPRGNKIPFYQADLKTVMPLLGTLRSLIVQAKRGGGKVKLLIHDTAI